MKKLSFLFLAVIFCSFSYASKGMKKDQLEKVYEGDQIIWSLEFLNSNEILFTEKNGKIKKLDLKTKKTTEIKNAPKSAVHGQGGLLDLKLHSNYPKDQRVYITYTKMVSLNLFTTALSIGTLSGSEIKNLKEVFVATPANPNRQHFGSRIAFDEKGFLFFTVGERGERDEAQKLSAHLGKVIRMNDDGSIPKDNPFVDQKDAKKEIWSYGHRNPQGLYFDSENKKLYLHEHGPRGGDEINLVEKGKNYGWPVVTHGKEYWGPSIGEGKTKKGIVEPMYVYVPSIAPSGLVIQKDKFFLGALAGEHLQEVDLKNKTEIRHFEDLKERIRDVEASPEREIYFSTDSGKIFKMKKQK